MSSYIRHNRVVIFHNSFHIYVNSDDSKIVNRMEIGLSNNNSLLFFFAIMDRLHQYHVFVIPPKLNLDCSSTQLL